MKAIIIEDEPRAANRLEKLIFEVDSTIQVLAKLESITEAVVFLQNNPNLDIVFSDIQLADGLSFEIFNQLGTLPPIIFTTAYDQYAITAFKNNGIDYLLKPIEKEDVANALNKLKQLSKPLIDSSVLALLANQISTQKVTYKERFMVKIGQHIKSVSTANINAFYSLDKTTYALTNEGKNYIIDFSLDHLDQTLNPALFFRVNRKFIIQINAQFQITAWTNSRLKITLPGYNEEMIIVARNRTKDFKTWLGED
tara:strand:- start:5084 stop:5845 length:762 start_codon:yes stop_codon:yes gene_type:complete